MPPRNVVLIGFMGAGKTAVGKALASRLGFDLFDTDDMVVERSGSSVADIWAAEGEAGFRKREFEAVVLACAGTRRVIACGGGAVLAIRNYGLLKGAGPIVYLRAPAELLRARVGAGASRPLLEDPAAFDRLLADRMPVYESAADVIVDVEGRTAGQVADDVAQRLP